MLRIGPGSCTGDTNWTVNTAEEFFLHVYVPWISGKRQLQGVRVHC